MAHYEFRSKVSGAGTPEYFSLAKQLATQRAGFRANKKMTPTPVRPSLTSSKEKESVIKETIEKSFLPSGLKLAKLRQLAAQHKIMGEMGRRFLHETEAGKKIQGKEGLVKLDTDILEAETEAIELQGGHDPRHFEYRKDADHPERLGKKMFSHQVHAAAEHAAAEAADKHATVMQERQAHHAMIHGILDRAPAAAPAVANAQPTAAPSLQQPTPLSASVAAHSTPFVPMSGGGHITQSEPTSQPEPVAIGAPVTLHHEQPSSPVPEPTPIAPEPTPTTPAAPDVQLPDMGHLSDPFGGDE
jgi:hypothetical protein